MRLVGTEKWTWFPTQTAAAAVCHNQISRSFLGTFTEILTSPVKFSQALNVEAGPISKCCNGAQRTAHGHEFKFALEKHQPDLSLKPPVIVAQSSTEVANLGEFGELKEPEDVVDMTLREGSEEKWLLYPDRVAVMQLLEYLLHSMMLLNL